MTPPNTPQAQIEGLATLLVLDEEIRKLSNIREFGFFSTNETHRLIPYHTAFLWRRKDIVGAKIIAQSGAAELDEQAPTNQWLKQKIERLSKSANALKIFQEKYDPTEMNESDLATQWTDSLPEYLLWCPLVSKSHALTGGLIFFRETPFTDAELSMLQWLINSYQYTWNVLLKPKTSSRWQKFREKPYLIAALAFLLLILFFPIRLSVMGTGTVTPFAPVLINGPMQGVIKSFAVKPGDTVKEGQLLLTLDRTELESTVDVDRKAYLLTQAKLRTAVNQGFENKEARSEVPILQAQLAIDKARWIYTNELLSKTEIKSPITGIVIFDSKEDWIGQPVRTGERILVVANPKKVELKIALPITDSIELSVGGKGEFYLYGKLKSLPVKIQSLGYNAKLQPNKILAYELTAQFENLKDPPQVGAQGTVRLYGHRVPLIYYFLRRPLEILRQTLGM